jgi:hypothetical protein
VREVGIEQTAAIAYEVREVSDGDPPLDLGLRFTTDEFFNAVDFACEYLEEHDPFCTGEVSRVEVVKLEGGERTTVLTYRHSEAMAAKSSVEIWGFDATLPWRGVGGLKTGTGSAPR